MEDRLQVVQVGCPVEDFFLLVLGVSLKLSLINIHKGLGVTQAAVEERLELVPRYRDSVIYVSLLLILLPVETDPVPGERRSKRGPGRS